MRTFVVETSRHPFFKKGVKIDELRFAHRYLAAQITLLEDASDLKSEPVVFGNPRYTQLCDMYEKYKHDLPSTFRHKVRSVLDFLYRVLGEDARVIHKKSDVLTLYVFVSYLRHQYIVDLELLREFIIGFFTKIAQVRLKENIPPEDDYEIYASLRRKGLSPVTFKNRFDILLKLFLSRATNMQLKDNKRLFDVGQKLAIFYSKDKGICQYEDCLDKKVCLKDASFHHIKFHRLGGPTTVENGQLMHENCHKDYHAKYGQDEDY
jgi:hypothetical protein